MKTSQANASEEEKQKHEQSLVAAAKFSNENLWNVIDESAIALNSDRRADVFVGYLQNENITDDKFDEILAESKILFKYSEKNLIKVVQEAAASYSTSEQVEILTEEAQKFPAEERRIIQQNMRRRTRALMFKEGAPSSPQDAFDRLLKSKMPDLERGGGLDDAYNLLMKVEGVLPFLSELPTTENQIREHRNLSTFVVSQFANPGTHSYYVYLAKILANSTTMSRANLFGNCVGGTMIDAFARWATMES